MVGGHSPTLGNAMGKREVSFRSLDCMFWLYIFGMVIMYQLIHQCNPLLWWTAHPRH